MMKLLRRLVMVAAVWRSAAPVLSPKFGPGQQHPLRLPGRTIFVGDRELLVREAGPVRAPPALLVHGLGGASLAEWYKVVPLLQDRYRLVLVDHRQHGRSDHQREPYEIEDVADDLAAVLDALDIGQAAVVGYSMGGVIAQMMAYRHPHRVTKLALIAALDHHPQPDRTFRSIFTLLVRAWERITGLGTPEVRAGYLLWKQAVDPEHARWLWGETHRRDPDAGSLATQALLRFDSRDWIGKLTQPALVIIPIEDQLVPPEWQYQMAGRLGDPRIVEIGAARHEVPWTHPEALAAALADFL